MDFKERPDSRVDPTITEADVEQTMRAINAFIAQAPFQAMLREMRRLPAEERRRFVEEVVINPAAHAERGITVPPGMIVQRSVFMDGRPTLFCVAKHLRDGARKMTVTFDDPM
jgi:hypothetical protein